MNKIQHMFKVVAKSFFRSPFINELLENKALKKRNEAVFQ